MYVRRSESAPYSFEKSLTRSRTESCSLVQSLLSSVTVDLQALSKKILEDIFIVVLSLEL